MQCPACAHELTEKIVGKVAVDVCEGGCGGIWFDSKELDKFDEPHEHDGEELINTKRNPNSIEISNEVKRRCPRCKEILMMKHKFSIQRKVTIDECAQCGGIWLDVGELATIRGLYESHEERKAAAEKYFRAFSYSGPMGEARERSQAELDKAKRFANLFKYVCPSYYHPGDDSWGVF